jgi:hypothetical protein
MLQDLDSEHERHEAEPGVRGNLAEDSDAARWLVCW